MRHSSLGDPNVGRVLEVIGFRVMTQISEVPKDGPPVSSSRTTILFPDCFNPIIDISSFAEFSMFMITLLNNFLMPFKFV